MKKPFILATVFMLLFLACQKKEWYRGSILNKESTMADWEAASYDDKLAYCGSQLIEFYPDEIKLLGLNRWEGRTKFIADFCVRSLDELLFIKKIDSLNLDSANLFMYSTFFVIPMCKDGMSVSGNDTIEVRDSLP